MSDYSNLKVGIINLKLNNIYSIHQLFKYLKSKVTIIDQSKNLKKYDIIVLPGDGAFKEGMKKLKSSKLYDEIINFSKIKEKKVLGICLGMQLLFDKSSEFGYCKGLGLVNGKVTKLPKKSAFVPNIGWRKLKTSKNKIFNLFNKSYFYFSHSFYAVPKKSKIITSFINHGNKKICTSIQYENIFGMQFHPEKSHKEGVKLIKKVLDYK